MEIPAGRARPSKQTSVKNRRMNPPRFELRVGRQQVDRAQARDPRRHTAARGRRGETHTEYSKKKVYQDGPTSGIEPVCPPGSDLYDHLINRLARSWMGSEK